MDFTNFTLIEMAGALEAQREEERRERKWLLAWRRLEREPVAAAVITPIDPGSTPLRPAA